MCTHADIEEQKRVKNCQTFAEMAIFSFTKFYMRYITRDMTIKINSISHMALQCNGMFVHYPTTEEIKQSANIVAAISFV